MGSCFFGVEGGLGSLGTPGGFGVDFEGVDLWGVWGDAQRSFETIVMSTGSGCELSFDTILL